MFRGIFINSHNLMQSFDPTRFWIIPVTDDDTSFLSGFHDQDRINKMN